MTDNTEFLNLLKVGSKVAVHEGHAEHDALTEVLSVDAKYICVMRYPSLRFDRQTGKQIPRKKGDRTYRFLFSPAEWQARANHEEFKAKLVDILIESTLTLEKYEQCRKALECILSERVAPTNELYTEAFVLFVQLHFAETPISEEIFEKCCKAIEQILKG